MIPVQEGKIGAVQFRLIASEKKKKWLPVKYTIEFIPRREIVFTAKVNKKRSYSLFTRKTLTEKSLLILI